MTNVTYQIYIDWDNDGSVLSGSFTTGEDVSAYVLGVRTPLSWAYGRDTARSLAQIQPGDMTLELNNLSLRFSPDNMSSPLYGNLKTGRPVLVRSTLSGTTRNLFWGFIDDFTIDPNSETQSVKISVIDGLAKIADTDISTEVFSGVQTGEAIGHALDAAGWPSAQRDLDPGATTIRYWWEDGTSALDAIKAIVSSEGGPAIAYIDPANGNFVFRDRHHRFVNSPSISSQVTFNDGSGSEPHFSSPVDYNIGFKDLANSVQFDVNERAPDVQAAVWSTDDVITLAAGETITLPAKANDPFDSAVIPVQDIDYVLLSGAVTMALSRTSGQSVDISIHATATSYIQGLQLRACPIPVARTYSVSSENPSSVDDYGATAFNGDNPTWAGRHDAQAIADIIIAQRSERLPVMTITVNNGNDTRKVQQLTRRLSDRVHIVEPRTGTDHDHFIEVIEHSIDSVGKDHTVSFGCERVRSQTTPLFTFGASGKGFDQGYFGLSGFDDSSSLLILGSTTSGHRLDEGKLGT